MAAYEATKQHGNQASRLAMVAYLGPQASYTHQAALQRFSESEYTLSSQTSIEGCFAQVQHGTATYSVVPFENSSNGSVVFTLDLFADHAEQYQNVAVVGEIYLPVRHCLVGRCLAAPASPDVVEKASDHEARLRASLSRIRKIYSHPQAWGQCKRFLTTYLHGIERQDVSSTSRGAEIVARERLDQGLASSSAATPAEDHDSNSASSAAISSALAADIHGLDILAQGIEDVKGNSTRFLILCRWDFDETAPLPLPPPTSLATQPSHSTTTTTSATQCRYKSLFSFTVDRSTDPGALADCLAVFREHDLNLTSINTRPSGKEPWDYVFFVELQQKGANPSKDKTLAAALMSLSAFTDQWRWLGSWENMLGR